MGRGASTKYTLKGIITHIQCHGFLGSKSVYQSEWSFYYLLRTEKFTICILISNDMTSCYTPHENYCYSLNFLVGQNWHNCQHWKLLPFEIIFKDEKWIWIYNARHTQYLNSGIATLNECEKKTIFEHIIMKLGAAETLYTPLKLIATWK